MKAVFKSSIPFCRFSFPNGKEAIFMNGEYLTDNYNEIKHLQDEIEQNHPHIYVDPNKLEVDTVFRDPMDVIRAQVREELLAEQEAIKKGIRDHGNSEETKLNVGNTTNAGAAMSGSTSIDSAGAGTATTATSVPISGAKIVAGPITK